MELPPETMIAPLTLEVLNSMTSALAKIQIAWISKRPVPLS